MSDSTPGNQSHHATEDSIEAFEKMWRLGDIPSISNHLATAGSVGVGASADLLWELIAVDLEHRWRATVNSPAGDDQLGLRPMLSAYLEYLGHPAEIAELPAWLVAEEYRARRLWGADPTHDQFLAEFPAQWRKLMELLPAIDRELIADGAAPKPPSNHFVPAEQDPRAPLPYSDYLLEEHLGTGGMGKVYRAKQSSLRRSVAIKALVKSRQHDRCAVERFIQEARIVAQLRHPNIVDVHGLGRFPGGGYFLVMELIDGEDLAVRIAREVLPVGEAVRITCEVAAAVEHAHEQGVIHCDLKPANVLIDRQGHVFVADFGLACLVKPTAADGIGGTVGFIAPEQVDSDLGDIGPATDVFGLGALLYALLTARAPGDLSFPDQDCQRPRIRQFRSDVASNIEDLCSKCLAPHPKDRFQRANDVVIALQKCHITVSP